MEFKKIIDKMKSKYDEIVRNVYNNNYVEALQNFDDIAEKEIKPLLTYVTKNKEQIWRNNRGKIYEYAVYKALENIVNSDEKLKASLKVIQGDSLKSNKNLKSQIVIRNWSDIMPDADIIIIDVYNNVKAIISCKTSLRERLTETAFWKRELERNPSTKKVKIVFITIDKDDELKIDTNRYIIQHVIDFTFITSKDRYSELLFSLSKYKNKPDYNQLISKIKFFDENNVKDFLQKLLYE
ncbi:MAG: hypothetical protein JZD41_09060 [Thermoproteus sp.]|nr:hypothetical protein [Thermoproteus sp.]